MEPSLLLRLILIFLVVNYLWEQILDYLNLRHQKAEIPAPLQDIVDQETYNKTLAYQKVRTRFGFLTSALSLVVMVTLLASGAFGWFNQQLAVYISNPMVLALAFFGLLYFTADLLSIPLQWYSIFVIEERFGFNKTTAKTFWMDKLKGYLLTAMIGAPVLMLLLYLIQQLGGSFWLVFLGFLAVLSLVINMFYTSWILPLFNKLAPLEEGELKAAIEQYSASVDFPLDNIFVIDGSKRSNKSNAFFSGLGRKKKIVLYDTLIENHDTQELVSILAHEVGHYKKKHILQSYVLSLVQSGLMLFILSLMVFNPALSQALGAETSVMHLNLMAFGLLYTPISKVLGILFNVLSRKNEFQADAFAAQTSSGPALKDALKKLSLHNLSNLWPHKWFVFFHYSHPPLLQRLQALDRVSK